MYYFPYNPMMQYSIPYPLMGFNQYVYFNPYYFYNYQQIPVFPKQQPIYLINMPTNMLNINRSFSNEISDDDESEESNIIQFPYSDDKKLNGIIAHLRNKCGGNIVNKNLISIDSNHDKSGYREISCLFEDNPNLICQFRSDPYFIIDFKDMRVQISAYTLRSNREFTGPNWFHPKSWSIEGSNDKHKYNELDRQNNSNVLNNQGVTHTFKTNSLPSDFYRFIRFRHFGNSWNNMDSTILRLNAIEFYGQLQE